MRDLLQAEVTNLKLVHVHYLRKSKKTVCQKASTNKFLASTAISTNYKWQMS